MGFKKITITLPDDLYFNCQMAIENGLFSNISDMIRAGIRHELKESRSIFSNKSLSAKSILNKVNEESSFILTDGNKLRSIMDLYKALYPMEQSVFEYHVNSSKNYFSELK